MSALNVAAIWSPARSMSLSRSSCDAVAWPSSLTIASSAARWRVSSTSRAFSSATLRLAASVRQQPDVGLAEGVRAVEVLERDPAEHLAAADISGAKTIDFGGSPWIVSSAAASLPPRLDVVDDDGCVLR